MHAHNPGDPAIEPKQTAPLALSSLLELNAEGFDPLLSAGVEAGAWAVQVPLVHWIVGAIRPRVLVELGSADSLSYAALCHAVERLALGTRCCAVTGVYLISGQCSLK